MGDEARVRMISEVNVKYFNQMLPVNQMGEHWTPSTKEQYVEFANTLFRSLNYPERLELEDDRFKVFKVHKHTQRLDIYGEQVHLNDVPAQPKELGLNIVAKKPRKIFSPFKRRNKKRLTTVSLPQEIIFNILVRLPARDIYKESRLVCREWKDMTHTRNFIYTHLMNAPTGLIIRTNSSGRAFIVAMKDGLLEVSEINNRLHSPFWCSCNGLLLVDDPNNPDRAIVVNPITNQKILLPPFHREWFPSTSHAAFAYVRATMEYKVFIPHELSDELQCFTLTIGVDKVWRRIDMQHLSLTLKKAFYCFTPLCIEGFIVWNYGSYILALNVETEKFQEFSFPGGYSYKYTSCSLTMGGNLSCLGQCDKFFWEVWEMKTKTREWTKLVNIDLEGQLEGPFFTQKYSLWPVGWLKSREWLVFRVIDIVHIPSDINLNVVYNIKTQAIQLLELDNVGYEHRYAPHVNSLVFLDGQYQ